MLQYRKIKKKDAVKVLCGKDVGKTGNVLEVDRDNAKILIEGINLHKKAMRKTKQDQTGGIKEVEGFINISNVMLICPKCKKPTRVGFSINEKDGQKRRICKKC